MHPTPIPDAEIWPGAVRQVIAGPDGDLTNDQIRPVEALIDMSEIGPRFSMRCELEDRDLAVLQAGGVVWVSQYGDHLHPFSVDVAPAYSTQVPSLHVEVRATDGPAPRFDVTILGLKEGADVGCFVAGVIEALQEMVESGLTDA